MCRSFLYYVLLSTVSHLAYAGYCVSGDPHTDPPTGWSVPYLDTSVSPAKHVDLGYPCTNLFKDAMAGGNRRVLEAFAKFNISEDTWNGVNGNAAAWDGGWNLLSYAAYGDNTDLVSFLLKKGASANWFLGDFFGTTSRGPLGAWFCSKAADENKTSTETLRLLLEAGSKINDSTIQHCGGYTPLQAAAYRGNFPQIDLLLRFGADINLAYSHPRINYPTGDSAASIRYLRVEKSTKSEDKHCKVGSDDENLSIIKYLYSKGAKLNISNSEKLSLLDRAKICKHNQVVKFIEENTL